MSAVTEVVPATTSVRAPNGTGRTRNRFGPFGWVLFAAVSVVVGYLVVVPLVLLLLSSFRPTGYPLDPGLTLDNYRTIYLSGDTYRLLWTTIQFAVGSTVVAVAVGAVLAWLVERTDLPGRSVLRALVLLPMGVPPVLLAISWVLILSPRVGFVNQLVHQIPGLENVSIDIFGMPGMIFVQGLSVVPTVFLVLGPAFRNLDASVEEAARTSGASAWLTMRRIVFPLLWPATLAAATFVVIVGMVSFDVPGVLGLPSGVRVLSSAILEQSSPTSGFPKYGTISALLSLFLVLLVALAAVYYRQTSRSYRYVTVGGRAYQERRAPLGRWRVPAAMFAWLYVVCGAIAPLGILVWTSLLPYYSGVTAEAAGLLSLDNYRTIFDNPSFGEVARNTVIVAGVSATAVAALCAVVSWLVVRTKVPGRKVLDVLAFVPLAIPHVLIGLALIYVYLSFTVVNVYGTIWILVIAFVTTYISFGTRVVNSVVLQIDPVLEEAARTSGATMLRTFLKVTTPILRPALVVVWIWVAAHAMRELSAALMLQGADNQVVATFLWGYWTGGESTKAAAVGVVLIGAVLAMGAAWVYSSRRQERAR